MTRSHFRERGWYRSLIYVLELHIPVGVRFYRNRHGVVNIEWLYDARLRVDEKKILQLANADISIAHSYIITRIAIPENFFENRDFLCRVNEILTTYKCTRSGEAANTYINLLYQTVVDNEAAFKTILRKREEK